MLGRRCPSCAERIEPAVLFRSRPCPSCGARPSWAALDQAESVVEALAARWGRRRVWAYAVLGLAAGVAGLVPLLSTFVALAFMLALRHAVLVEPLRWFGPARRFTTSFTLQLWLATTGLVTFALDALLGMVPVASFALKGLACLATTALFVEAALWLLRNRVRREAREGPELEAWEWALPTAALGGTLVATGGAVAAFVFLVHVVTGLFR